MMRYLLSLTALCLIATGGTAQDARRGEELALRWCTVCHVVTEGQAGGDIGPPFALIAEDALQTDISLRHWLNAPHDPMPDLQLTEPEISDIIAYIRALR